MFKNREQPAPPPKTGPRSAGRGPVGKPLRSTRQLMVTGLALSGLWVVVLYSLRDVFGAGVWFAQAVTISTATVMSASILRSIRPSWHTAAGLGGGLVGLLLWVWWLYQSGRVDIWRHESGFLIDQIQRNVASQAPPMDILGPLTEIVLLMVLLVSTVTALVLVGLRLPLTAGVIPALLMLICPAITGAPHHGATLIVAGLALAVLAWLGSPRPNPTALIAAACAVVMAAVAMSLVPATRDQVWNEGVVPAPVSDSAPDVTIALAEDLRRGSNTPAFNFTASEPGSYRFTLATLSEFTGGQWFPDSDVSEDSLDVTTARDVSGHVPAPYDDVPEPGTTVTVTIEGLLSSWLPLPQATTGLLPEEHSGGFDPEEWLWSADSNTAQTDTDLTQRDDQFTAEGGQLFGYSDLDPEQEGPDLHPGGDDAPEGVLPYLELPDGMPEELLDVAQEATSEADNRLAVGFALQSLFRGGTYLYDESAPYQPGQDPDDPYEVMVSFLETQRGFCVHYASTFAVMARAMGAPTRIAVGYASQISDQERAEVVRNSELHAWPEIYIHDVGWVAFEPTPGGAGVPEASEEATPPEAEDEPSQDVESPLPEEDPSEADELPEPGESDAPSPTGDTPQPEPLDATFDTEADGRVDAMGVLQWAAVALMVVALLLAPAGFRLMRTQYRRRRVIRGSSPAQRTWAQFLDTARDLGWLEGSDGKGMKLRAQTPQALVEYLQQNTTISPSTLGVAGQVAEAVTRERYGGQQPSEPSVEKFDAVGAGLAQQASRSRWWSGMLLPRSVLRPRRPL